MLNFAIINRKKFLLIAFIFGMLLFQNDIKAQIYVSDIASGNNDGSSWADAYATLISALENSSEGDIFWITEGQYFPPQVIDNSGAEPDTTNYFLLSHNVKLYGGFAGGETSLDQRNTLIQPTVINGDILGNDNGTFIENRADNARHLFFVEDTITNETVFDGIYFIGGHTMEADGSGDERRGAAILSYGSPIINGCYFSENYGYFGGGVYPRGGDAQNTKITNCSFTGNGGAGAAMYAVTMNGLEISNCSFEDNISRNSGGALYFSNVGYTMNNCSFLRNQGTGTGRGGAIRNDSCRALISNCEFKNNSVPSSSGGALYFNDYSNGRVSNSQISNNSAGYGNITCYSDSDITIDSCLISNNEAMNNGGGIYVGFRATVRVMNSNIQDNSSVNTGGGIGMQNENGQLFVENCTFIDNESMSNGGGIGTTSENKVWVTNSSFTGNIGDFGGGISFSEDSLDLAELHLDRVSFVSNIAQAQGGALNVSEANVSITNCLMLFNLANGLGNGGAISNNSSASNNNGGSVITITNSTIGFNQGEAAANLVQWQQDTGRAEIIIVNSIIHADDFTTSYEIEAGLPIVTSLGSNICNDDKMNDYLTESSDKTSTDPLFEDPFSLEFTPLATSPAVGAANPTYAPEFDFNGNRRSNMPDIGAIEFDPLSAISNEKIEGLEFKLLQNPVADQLSFSLDFESNFGNVYARIIDLKGRTITQQKVNAGINQFDLNKLQSGMYIITIQAKGQQMLSPFIKK